MQRPVLFHAQVVDVADDHQLVGVGLPPIAEVFVELDGVVVDDACVERGQAGDSHEGEGGDEGLAEQAESVRGRDVWISSAWIF